MVREQLHKAPDAPASARRFLDDALVDQDCGRIDDARLLLSELVTNAVRHGEGAGPIELAVRCEDRLLHVEVHDNGPGFAPPERTADSPLDSGWGLYLVRTLSDRWGVAADGSDCVWFELTA